MERKEAERDFNDLAYDVQQREREETVESKAGPARAVQASWTNRAHPKVQFPEPPPKARPKAAPEAAQEPVPKPAPKPAAEMMVIDADDGQWGDWPKGKNWWKKQRKRKGKEKQRLRREESKSSETKELQKNLQRSKRLAFMQLGRFKVLDYQIQIHIGTAQSACVKFMLESLM